jgi:KDO2-lipid IV(A) lauroyltransferase
MSAKKRKSYIRVENMESPLRAHKKGKGLIFLTGHFGNWEVATVAGITQFPQFKGLLHFVRRPINPKWLNQFVIRRFRRAGFGTIAKRGSLDTILNLLENGAIIVYVFDQHAGVDGIVVDFFGHPAGTFKSPALLAMSTGAPIIPASSWRDPAKHPRLQRRARTDAAPPSRTMDLDAPAMEITLRETARKLTKEERVN